MPNVNRISAALRSAGGLVVYVQNTIDAAAKEAWSNWFTYMSVAAVLDNQLAAAPIAATPADQASTQTAPATATPGNEPPAISNGSSPEPATSAEQTAAPDPLPSLDPADRAVAGNIRDLLAARADKLFASKKERSAVETFYQNCNFVPLWLDKGVENARAGSIIARLKDADTDGLEPGEYRTPNFAGLAPDALAEAELRLTRAVLTYARHVQAGRFPIPA